MAEPETLVTAQTSAGEEEGSEAQARAQIEALEAALNDNPSDSNYENHVQYIKILRKQREKEKLRQAREKMNSLFPLSPEMWREWTKDETDDISPGSEAVLAVENLYERGVSEYLSLDLWCDYLKFVQAHDPSVREHSLAGIMKTRELFRRAHIAAGLHFTEGYRIWELNWEFERDFFLTIEETDSKAKEQQIMFMRSLFHRKLGIPLSNLESTLLAYKNWEAGNGISIDALNGELGGLPSRVLARVHKEALAMLNVHALFEENIRQKNCPSEKVLAYKTYLKVEHSYGNPRRIGILYERAIADIPTSTDLWLEYTLYLDGIFKKGSIVWDAYNRATRNCPSVGKLWVLYLLSLERTGVSEEKLSNVFEKSLRCTFSSMDEYLNIFLTRVDGLRRRISAPKPWSNGIDYAVIRDIFQRASDYLSPHLANTESLFRLLSYWARLELKLGKDIEAARGVWESLLKHCGTMLEAWQGFIAWEIEMGHINEARSLYKRCYRKSLAGTGSEDICRSWLRFEGEFGSLKDYDLANQEVAPRLLELQLFRMQEESKNIGQVMTTREKRKATSSAIEQSTTKRQKDIAQNVKKENETGKGQSRHPGEASETAKSDVNKAARVTIQERKD